MIKSLSKIIANRLSNKSEIKELYQYAFYIILLSLLHIITLVIIGIILGLVYESIVMYFSFILIRKYSGGFHASTPIRCYIFSVILIISFLLLQIQYYANFNFIHNIALLIIEILCVIIIFRYAPLENENNPLTRNEKQKYGFIAKTNTIILLTFSIFFLMFMQRFYCPTVMGIIMSAIVLLMQKIKNTKGRLRRDKKTS